MPEKDNGALMRQGVKSVYGKRAAAAKINDEMGA